MAAEVSEAAQQVQRLLAAEAQAEALQGKLASLRQRLEGREAEAAAEGRAAAEEQAVALAAAATAKAQVEELVREREQWIEEVRRERGAASAALEGLSALERRVAEGEGERVALAAQLAEARERVTTLEEEVTQLTGQQVRWGAGVAW